jgi:hypothetical protein
MKLLITVDLVDGASPRQLADTVIRAAAFVERATILNKGLSPGVVYRGQDAYDNSFTVCNTIIAYKGEWPREDVDRRRGGSDDPIGALDPDKLYQGPPMAYQGTAKPTVDAAPGGCVLYTGEGTGDTGKNVQLTITDIGPTSED